MSRALHAARAVVTIVGDACWKLAEKIDSLTADMLIPESEWCDLRNECDRERARAEEAERRIDELEAEVNRLQLREASLERSEQGAVAHATELQGRLNAAEPAFLAYINRDTPEHRRIAELETELATERGRSRLTKADKESIKHLVLRMNDFIKGSPSWNWQRDALAEKLDSLTDAEHQPAPAEPNPWRPWPPTPEPLREVEVSHKRRVGCFSLRSNDKPSRPEDLEWRELTYAERKDGAG